MAASSIIGALRVNLGLDSASFANGLRKSSQQAKSFQSDMLAIGAKVGGALAAAFSLRAMGQAADAWSDMSSRVGIAIGSMERAPEVMERIQEIAQVTYSPLQQTADGFVENAAALKEYGYSINDSLDYTEALNNALVVSGAKGERAASVARALSVAMATGKLSGDGLNSILSNGGRIAEVLAKELGTTRNGLIKLASDGKITGQVIASALLKNMEALRDEAGEMPATIADGFQRIGNSFTGLIGRMDQASGASATVAAALVGISDALDSVATVLIAVARIIGSVIAGIWDLGAATVQWINETTRIGDAIKWVWDHTVGWVVDLVVGFSNIIKATGSLGNAFSLMGEVIGGVWDGIKGSAQAIPVALQAVWEKVKSDFYFLIHSLVTAWAGFLEGLGTVSGFSGFTDSANEALGVASSWGVEAEAAGEAADVLKEKAKGMASDGFNKAREALSKLNVTVNAASDDLDGSSGLTGAIDNTGSKAGGAGKKLSKFQETIKALREQAELLRATFGMSDLDAEIWAKQREAGVDAASMQGQQIAGTMTLIDRMKSLKDATEQWRDSIKSSFASFVTGASSFKDMLSQIISKLAEMLANAAFDGLFKSIGGNGLVGGFLGMLGFSGGGYTGNGPRSGGLDGEGGFLAMMHPQETVIDHSKGQTYGGGGGGIAQIVPSKYFDVVVDGRIQRAAPALIGGSVQATSRASRKSKSFLGR